MDNGNSDDDDDIVIISGKKKDFIDAVKASLNSDGWMMSFNDYDAYIKWLGAADRLRHAVAKTKLGEFIGCCICFNMEDIAFIGMYYVRPKFRSKGIGKRLFDTAFPLSLRHKKNTGLHAAPKMSPVYDSILGFSHYTAWKSDIVQLCDIDMDKLKSKSTSELYKIKDVSEIEIEKLISYDESVYKSSRKSFVQNFIATRCDSICKVVLDNENEIRGYGCAHSLSNGSPILSPIYSDNNDVFIILINELLNFYIDELKKNNIAHLRPISIKTPIITTLLDGIAKIIKKGENSAQFTKFVPEHNSDKIFSLSDLNLWL